MKNLLIYYFAILMPIPLLAWSLYNNTMIFLVLLIGYVVYRGFIDGKRLIDKGLIRENQAWKAFIPFWTSKFFKEIYFEA